MQKLKVAHSEEVNDDLKTFAAWMPGTAVRARATEREFNMADKSDKRAQDEEEGRKVSE